MNDATLIQRITIAVKAEPSRLFTATELNEYADLPPGDVDHAIALAVCAGLLVKCGHQYRRHTTADH